MFSVFFYDIIKLFSYFFYYKNTTTAKDFFVSFGTVYAFFSSSMTSLVGRGFFSQVSVGFNWAGLKFSIPEISWIFSFSCWIAGKKIKIVFLYVF